MDFSSLFGQLIEECRKNHGFSQDDLAERVGMTRVTISNIESGKTRCSLETGLELCAALAIDVSEVQKLFRRNSFDQALSQQPTTVIFDIISVLNRRGVNA